VPEKQQITNQQKVMLVILGIIGLIVFYKRAFAPLGKKAKKYQEEIREKEQRLANIKRKIANLAQLEAEYKELKKEVEIAEKKLPRKKELPELIRSITDIGKKYGIDIDNFRPAGMSTPPGKNYIEYRFTLNLKSSYHRLAAFFTDICQQDRIININNLTLSPKTPTPDDPSDIQANFTLVVYTFKG